MPQRIGTSGKSGQCWAPVIGTMLILIGIFDFGFSSVFAEASIELGRQAGVVSKNSGFITVGHIFSTVSGGLLSIGSAEDGTIVKSVQGEIPPLWASLVLVMGRLILSLSSIVLGIALAKRMRIAVLPVKWWAIVSVGWGVLTMIFSLGLYGYISQSSGAAAAGMTVMMDVSLHVLWPLAVLWRVRLA